jgi:hypothetical protein
MCLLFCDIILYDKKLVDRDAVVTNSTEKRGEQPQLIFVQIRLIYQKLEMLQFIIIL